MPRPLSLLSFIVLPVAALLACSSSDDGPATGFIDQYCDLLVPCCSSGTVGTSPSSGPPGSGCREVYGVFTTSSKFDAAKGDSCLAEIRAHKAEPTFCSQVSSVAPSCATVFTGSTSGGTKQPGEACAKSSECAPSPEGKVDCSTANTCQLLIDGKEGDTPCSATKIGSATSFSGHPPRSFVCDTGKGLYCAKAGACARTKNVGDACDFSESYACGANSCSAGKCVERPPSSSSGLDLSLLFVCASKS